MTSLICDNAYSNLNCIPCFVAQMNVPSAAESAFEMISLDARVEYGMSIECK